MKKFTARNPKHPHNFYKAQMEEFKKRLSQLSKVALRQQALKRKVMAQGRSQKIKGLLTILESDFKAEWSEKHGWSFDDIYDPDKFAKHFKLAKSKRAPIKTRKPRTVQGLLNPQPIEHKR